MADFSQAGEVATGAWVALELGLRVRDDVRTRGRPGGDRGTRVIIGLALGGGVGLAGLATSAVPSLGMGGWPHAAVGAIVMWAGLALRVWAVVSLGRAFRTTVGVEPDQRVIERGPYRWVRHPSYTGLLLLLAGLGTEFGNWLALPLCLLPALAALLWRIRVEEAELARVLGGGYGAYAAHTKRLVPGVW